MMNGIAMETPSPASGPAPGPPHVLLPHLPSPLTLGLLPPPPPVSSSRPSAGHYHAIGAEPIASSRPVIGEVGAPPPIARVRMADIVPYEGAPCGMYVKAVEALSASLTRHNAAVIELGCDDWTVVRCALESTRMYFKAKAQCSGAGGGADAWKKSNRGVYIYRAGRALEDGDLTPPCMGDAFKCFGRVARAGLCAIARHLRLRSDVFNYLLDDFPLPLNEVSSSVLVATFSHNALSNSKMGMGGGKPGSNEVEKGLLTLVASDNPGIQVCDPNGHWYLADGAFGPRDLLLLTGRALSHATAGLRPAAIHRTILDFPLGINASGRASLVFKLMPQSNAVLNCSPIAAAGHVIPQSFVPITVSQFMDELSAEEDGNSENFEAPPKLVQEPSLRSVLSDPLSGSFLDDAVVVSCGHSFGGDLLKKVIEMARCALCNSEIETRVQIPNHALRAAAVAVKLEDDRRLFHNAALRKRRKEMADQMDALKRSNKTPCNASQNENGEITADGNNLRLLKGVQYPFVVNEKVIIKGNRRTPEKFVGKEAVITSQCLNGWYLLKVVDSGDSIRLQYRSLKKVPQSQEDERTQSRTLFVAGS